MITHYDKHRARYAVFSLACLAIMAILVTSACTAPVKPRTADDGLAIVQATLTGVYRSIANAAPTLTRSEYTRYMKAAGEAEKALNEGKAALAVGNRATASERLSVANSILLRLSTELAKRQTP